MKIKFNGFEIKGFEADISKEELEIIADVILAFVPGPAKNLRKAACVIDLAKVAKDKYKKESA